MTCIIGLQHEGKVYIGADGLITSGWEASASHTPKVVRLGAYLIGMAGRNRFLDLVRFTFVAPQDDTGKYDHAFMVRSFVPELRKLIQDAGAMNKEDSQTDESRGRLLVGVAGNLYEICEDFAIDTFTRGYHAIGAGATYALGAMAALADVAPRERVERSLEIAAQFCRACAPPFTILDI